MEEKREERNEKEEIEEKSWILDDINWPFSERTSYVEKISVSDIWWGSEVDNGEKERKERRTKKNKEKRLKIEIEAFDYSSIVFIVLLFLPMSFDTDVSI